jgi:sporulation protein YlmC with PRC-barrel domain
VEHKDGLQDPDEPGIPIGMPVYNGAGRRVGDVDSISIDQVSGKIARITVRQGHLFHQETPVPASLIASVTDCVPLSAARDAVKRLEPA